MIFYFVAHRFRRRWAMFFQWLIATLRALQHHTPTQRLIERDALSAIADERIGQI